MNHFSRREQRRHQRYRVLKEGKIIHGAHHTPIWVIIRDLSVGGAGVRVSPAEPIPHSFELLVVNEKLLFPAVVKWRKGELVGVEFVSEPRPVV